MSLVIGTATGGGGAAYGLSFNAFGIEGFDITSAPLTTSPASSKSAAELVRDNYFAANPDNLTYYTDKSEYKISLFYVDNGSRVIEDQSYINGEWIKLVSVNAIQGLAGSGTDFSQISENHIPAIGAGPDKMPYDSGIDVGVDVFDFGNKEIICKSIQVDPSESVNVGPSASIRERGGYLESHSNVSGKDYVSLDYEIDDSGTKKPTYDERLAKEIRVVTHPLGDVAMSDVNSYTLTPADSNDVHAIYLKLTDAVTNFRLQIVSNETGKPIHYYPNEVAWRKNELNKGNDFGSGEIKLELQSALAELSSVEITVNIMADQQINLLGDGSSPWRAIDRQIISARQNIATESYVNEEIDGHTQSLRSPTFVAFDSADNNVTYGGFANTALIRKRALSTNTDTFFQSLEAIPVTDAGAWTDWQNRESLIYV